MNTKNFNDFDETLKVEALRGARVNACKRMLHFSFRINLSSSFPPCPRVIHNSVGCNEKPAAIYRIFLLINFPSDLHCLYAHVCARTDGASHFMRAR